MNTLLIVIACAVACALALFFALGRREKPRVRRSLAEATRGWDAPSRGRSAPDSLLARALAFYVTGDLGAAFECCELVISYYPDYAAAYRNRGLVRSARGEHKQALADYNRALELDSEDVAACVHRAVLRDRVGDLQGAIDDLDRALRLDPRDVAAYVNRAILREKLGDTRGAMADYHQARDHKHLVHR